MMNLTFIIFMVLSMYSARNQEYRTEGHLSVQISREYLCTVKTVYRNIESMMGGRGVRKGPGREK